MEIEVRNSAIVPRLQWVQPLLVATSLRYRRRCRRHRCCHRCQMVATTPHLGKLVVRTVCYLALWFQPSKEEI